MAVRCKISNVLQETGLSNPLSLETMQQVANLLRLGIELHLPST